MNLCFVIKFLTYNDIFGKVSKLNKDFNLQLMQILSENKNEVTNPFCFINKITINLQMPDFCQNQVCLKLIAD